MDGVIDIKVPAWMKAASIGLVAIIGIALLTHNDKPEPTKDEPKALDGIRNSNGSIEI